MYFVPKSPLIKIFDNLGAIKAVDRKSGEWLQGTYSTSVSGKKKEFDLSYCRMLSNL